MSDKKARLVKRGFDINNGVPYEVWDVGEGRGVYVDYFAFSSKAFPVDMNSLMVDWEEMRSWPHDALGGEAIRDLGYEPYEPVEDGVTDGSADQRQERASRITSDPVSLRTAVHGTYPAA